MIRVLPVWNQKIMSTSSGISDSEDSCKDQYEPIKKLAMVQLQPPRNPNKPFTAFSIKDILSSNGRTHNTVTNNGIRRPHHARNNNHRNNIRIAAVSRIVRPWDSSPSPGGRFSENSSDADDEEINVDDDDEPVPASSKDVSPLDALMEMANKTFQGLETSEAADAKRREQAALFGKHQAPKKRRKSRTAFTNQQIYELEKRFLYQKYLTPADRDEIAQNLGLTNAQVITWFQNRRAKLKRDLEELKNDVVATKKLTSASNTDEEYGDGDSMDNSCTPPKLCKTPCKTPEPRSPEEREKRESGDDKSPGVPSPSPARSEADT